MDNIKDLRKSFLKQAQARKVELTDQLSQCDLATQDALHYLENEKCDAVSMVKTAKLLKELRTERRQVKMELDQVTCLLASVGNKDILKFEKVTKYHYRTKLMDDIRKRNRRS